MNASQPHRPNRAAEKIAAVAALFPQCVTERPDGRGGAVRELDFEALRRELAGGGADDGERYRFDWPGKRAAARLADAPTAAVPRPCREESVDFDTTGNLYLEGDNLDALKLLERSCAGRVRTIYIDPPYNTGNRFVYGDSFAGRSGRKSAPPADAAEADGRLHAGWLNMIYPRLRLAHRLLREDGLIFISIDDNEAHNLRKLCDEIFGSANFLNQLIWVANPAGRQIAGRGAAKTWESILVYARNIAAARPLTIDAEFAKAVMPDAYKGFNVRPETDALGPYRIGDTLYNHNRMFNEETRKNLVFSIFYRPETGELIPGEIGESMPGFLEIPPHPNRDGRHRYHAWRWSRQKIRREAHNLLVRPKRGGGYEIFTKIRSFGRTLLKDILPNIPNGDAELRELFGGRKIFDYPKSVSLLQTLIAADPAPDGIVLDFFAGSATTAHAVMRRNAETGERRRFILVQLPEPCAAHTEAGRSGHATICEIGKERLRRAGARLREAWLARSRADGGDAPMPDFGFRVLKLASPDPAAARNWTDDGDAQRDRLFQEMLAQGLELSSPIAVENLAGHPVWFAGGDALAACFDAGIDDGLLRALAARGVRCVLLPAEAAGSEAVGRFRQTSPRIAIRAL